MTSDPIEKRLRLGEDSVTEFKRIEAPGKAPKDLAETIAAFANALGGQIFLGVEDDGTPTGVGTMKEADTLMLSVVQACQTVVHPAIWCPITKVDVSGKLLLVVDVPASSPDRPYRAKHVYWIRDGSMTREATRHELVRMLQSQNAYHDESVVHGATMADLDLAVVDDLLRSVYDPSAPAQRNRYLRALKCVDPGETPTVAGLLLFGREPERWFVDARISAVCFAGTGMSTELVDRQEITGHLLKQIESAAAFLERYTPAPALIQRWERIERGVPQTALREALLNAVAHRDYRAASQIRILAFQDRVEIINPGVLLNHLTLDSIQVGGISQRRNPVLASVLARARRGESLGMGIPEMVAQMRARGLPPPEFDLQGGHFRVVLRVAPSPEARA
ncbi:ATP-binding protein [Sorangium sp. So ce394]|uniref:ATP-binding protein n=1 Tax=Sorangium sp. So ce394 TaxID=3133310 RepID=UPI003F5BABAC